MELLPSQDFRTPAPAKGTGDAAVLGMILLEAGHALYFSRQSLKVELRALGKCAFAEIVPMVLHRNPIQLGDFPDGKAEAGDTPCLTLARLQEGFIKDGFCCLKFTHSVS